MEGQYGELRPRLPVVGAAVCRVSVGEIKRVAFNDDPTTAQRLVAGGSAGAIACFVTYPLDFIRGRLTTDMAGRYTSVGGALADVVRNEGFFALYRGLLPSIIGIVPYVGVDFAV